MITLPDGPPLEWGRRRFPMLSILRQLAAAPPEGLTRLELAALVPYQPQTVNHAITQARRLGLVTVVSRRRGQAGERRSRYRLADGAP